MGLEVSDEFQPITPARTVPRPRTSMLVDLEDVKEDMEECRTPKAGGHRLKSCELLVCPGAPRKAPAGKRKRSPDDPPLVFFKVPRDLGSVFLLESSYKIRACN